MFKSEPFRFSGPNIYWLGLLETPQGVSYPSHFMVDDALATAETMGATVVRSHTLGISVGCPLCLKPTSNSINPTAFEHIDYAIQAAKEHHIKLIIPLVDNWHYYHGGKHTFTDWRNMHDEKLFYTNATVINDFEHYISLILNHKNSYSGSYYKDDPTIMAWETGNELSAPSSWVQTIADYLKALDAHHLIMDGNHEWADNTTNFTDDLALPTVDIYTAHYYPVIKDAFKTQLQQVENARKTFLIGEYDWNTTKGDTLSDFLQTVEQSGATGDLYWSLFPHNDTSGFVQQKEHYTLHYPGDSPTMSAKAQLLRTHAYTMQGEHPPPDKVIGVPAITAVDEKNITWRGTVGASTYSIERSTTSDSGPWIIVCDHCTTDNTQPWVDDTKTAGFVWYRIRGYSLTGVAGDYSIPYIPLE